MRDMVLRVFIPMLILLGVMNLMIWQLSPVPFLILYVFVLLLLEVQARMLLKNDGRLEKFERAKNEHLTQLLEIVESVEQTETNNDRRASLNEISTLLRETLGAHAPPKPRS